ncbi:hypothetical protein FA95DRAFT_1497345 [Auriscalpium vulgare]|uniref:Uncharacterized protein n=1 Tax=Auriscalpium vulgare TaxID=40419 RepID=A0ACB8RJR7_9AGAM|nr:hypothetical protein FA95DRAFT_1497345 [Auriscalpium vulgare]
MVRGLCIVPCRGIRSGVGALPLPPALTRLENSEDTKTARDWLARFRAASIPKDLVELSFSRSSGPGGQQNVNKVNTKATLRCSPDAPWVPLWARDALRRSPAYAASSQSILITSTVHRSQARNIDDCLSKLHSLIVTASAGGIRSEPSAEQTERVRGLERAEKARRRQQKDYRSQVKRNRTSRDGE